MIEDVFKNVPVLKTERCILRPVSMEDVGAMFEVMNDPLVARFLGRSSEVTEEMMIQRVEAHLQRVEQQIGLSWIVEYENRVIGNALIFGVNPHHSRAEIGYVLVNEYRGRGLVTEVMQAVIRLAFGEMGLHSLEAHIDPENIASQRVLEKLGFVQEGYFRESFYSEYTGQFGDSAVFSLLNK